MDLFRLLLLIRGIKFLGAIVSPTSNPAATCIGLRNQQQGGGGVEVCVCMYIIYNFFPQILTTFNNVDFCCCSSCFLLL